MVINHLERLLVTKDASTIMNELEVQHPAAKMLVFAAQAQESEIGDGTNLVRDCMGPRDLRPRSGDRKTQHALAASPRPGALPGWRAARQC